MRRRKEHSDDDHSDHPGRSLLVMLGNQLFAQKHLPAPTDVQIFMAEDLSLCTYVRHHQQKLVLFLAAMRSYADELRAAGYQVHYHELQLAGEDSYEDRLDATIVKLSATEIQYFEIEDRAMEHRVQAFVRSRKLEHRELTSPMFLSSRDSFAAFAANKSRLLMGDFYKQQRRQFRILMDADDQPVGGQWSFDADNRKKLPKGMDPPKLTWPPRTTHVEDLVPLIGEAFADHPGNAAQFRWPTTRQQAQRWLDDFIKDRLQNFGPYEDALSSRSSSVFHSAISPYLNMGLLTPADVVERVLQHRDKVPLQSIEGFMRQVIGWREFVRGIYRTHGEQQDAANFWSHDRELSDAWYTGSTGILPLDDTIMTAQELGWTHHIPRLMVVANLMTLCEIRPTSAHRWFMEMYIDSSEWVMGPNVYGMGIFSDGGIFATKPYICGSNYLLKMSDYRKGPWCDIVDGLYWRFIEKNRDFFAGNPRLALMPKALDRLNDSRRLRIFAAAEEFLGEFTCAAQP